MNSIDVLTIFGFMVGTWSIGYVGSFSILHFKKIMDLIT